MKILKLIISVLTIITIVLVLLLIRFNNENKLINDYLLIKSKPIEKVNKKEWKRHNEYLVFKAKKDKKKPDTISFDQMQQNLAEDKLKLLEDIIFCEEDVLVENFHKMMAFNKPYDKYDKDTINIIRIDECTIRVNVTTTEPKYGFKTFSIYEVSYDKTTNNYKMERVDSKFIG